MKNNLKKLFLLFLLFISIVGCSQTRQITIATTIPATMQQLIKSTKVDGVDYSFRTNPSADLCKYKYKYGGLTVNNEVNINASIEPLLFELIQTKFSNIDEASPNKVDVKISDIDCDESNATLKLVIDVGITHNDKTSSKQLAYSMVFPYTSSEQPAVIHSFLMKFVIGIDKFIDNEFDVQ